MSNLKAIIKDGIIDQIIVASDEHAATLSDTVVDISNVEAAIGWIHNGGTDFSNPLDTSSLSLEELDKLNIEKTYTEEEIRQVAINWRNQELDNTDHFVPLTDHPDHAKILAYRVSLRDWPSTDLFPQTPPSIE